MQSKFIISELFNNSQQEYKYHSDQIFQNLIILAKQSKEQPETNINQIREEMNQAEQCLKHMELEAQSQPQNIKRDMMDAVKISKKELQKVEKDLRRIELEQDQTDLFGDRPNQSQINQSLLKQEDRQIEQNFKLMGAKQTAYGAEEIAITIQRTLHDQSNTLQNSIKKSQNVREDLGESNALVNRMKLRIQQRKLVVYSVFGLLSVCASYIVFKWLS